MSGPGRQPLARPALEGQYLVLGDLVGHELLQQVEVHCVAGLRAAGSSGSLRQGRCGREQSTHARYSPSDPAGPQSQTYPLVNELKLEVALTAVWVGLSARLQRVPLVLLAAQVLAGRAVRGYPCPSVGTGRR